jgi:hypothetical protein
MLSRFKGRFSPFWEGENLSQNEPHLPLTYFEPQTPSQLFPRTTPSLQRASTQLISLTCKKASKQTKKGKAKKKVQKRTPTTTTCLLNFESLKFPA